MFQIWALVSRIYVCDKLLKHKINLPNNGSSISTIMYYIVYTCIIFNTIIIQIKTYPYISLSFLFIYFLYKIKRCPLIKQKFYKESQNKKHWLETSIKNNLKSLRNIKWILINSDRTNSFYFITQEKTKVITELIFTFCFILILN